MNHSDLKDVIRRALGPSIDGTIVAAVSGGPDSMAMFHSLCELARERGSLRVVAAYFDHRLRPQSHRDAEPVDEVAARFGVRVLRGDGDVAVHAVASRQSIEAAARELRYSFLERAADEAGADVIATAHTRSDQVETVMMRILRGADTRGLRGIAARRGRIVRPLLDVSRADTVEYCDTRRVPYVNDPSNADRRFFRNRVRHDVLPSLRRVYPGLDAALERTARSAAARFDEAEAATRGRLDAWLRCNAGEWTLASEAFDGLDDEQRVHMIAGALDRMGAKDVIQAHYRSMNAGRTVDLPGLRVRREHDGLVFMPRGSRTGTDATPLMLPGKTRIGDWTIDAERVSGSAARETLPVRVSHVALSAAGGPFAVRFARPGDRMRPFGMSGHKKLSDLFIDRKIPRRERARIPVVECNGEIVWVVGVSTSESARVTANTEDVIRLSAVRSAAA